MIAALVAAATLQVCGVQDRAVGLVIVVAGPRPATAALCTRLLDSLSTNDLYWTRYAPPGRLTIGRGIHVPSDRVCDLKRVPFELVVDSDSRTTGEAVCLRLLRRGWHRP